MVVQVEESILIAAAGIIFVPLFLFCIKLIIEIGNMKGQLKNILDKFEEQNNLEKIIIELQSDVKVNNLRLANLEKERKGV